MPQIKQCEAACNSFILPLKTTLSKYNCLRHFQIMNVQVHNQQSRHYVGQIRLEKFPSQDDNYYNEYLLANGQCL